MEWTSDAEKAIKKVPFFVRKKVKARVEKEARAAGKMRVGHAEVTATKNKYLSDMSAEIKGFQLDACFGSSGCPRQAVDSSRLFQKIETIMEKEDLLKFLKNRVPGDIKFHHELRITLADCPNACSQPQIKDMGIIGAVTPAVTDEPCTLCEACVDVCKETAVALNTHAGRPEIDDHLCLDCGQCIHVCPTGTLSKGKNGFRVQLGGKLGRHPVLAKELPGIFTEHETLTIIQDAIAFYKKYSTEGQRFSELFQTYDFKPSVRMLKKP